MMYIVTFKIVKCYKVKYFPNTKCCKETEYIKYFKSVVYFWYDTMNIIHSK